MLGPLFLIISGEGINCEFETQYALELAGAKTKIIHINDLVERPELLKSAQGLIFPGGFSYGDELGSGQVLSLKIKAHFKEELLNAAESGMAIAGICNGFQVLVRLGLLPEQSDSISASLEHNSSKEFIDRWVQMEVLDSICWWTQFDRKELISMPIRHGEGRLNLSREGLKTIKDNKQIVLKYTEQVNGSVERIAGICNKRGNIFGLMPHPEAALYNFQNNLKTKDLGPADGQKIFKSIVDTLNKL